MGSVGKGSISVSSTEQLIYNALVRQRGAVDIPDLDKLEREAKTADFNRLLELSKETGASTTVGFDMSQNQEGVYTVVNGELRFNGQPQPSQELLNEVRDNPVSVAAIRESIQRQVDAQRSRIEMAKELANPTTIREAIQNNRYRNEIIGHNPRVVGLTQGTNGWQYRIEYDVPGSASNVVNVYVPRRYR